MCVKIGNKKVEYNYTLQPVIVCYDRLMNTGPGGGLGDTPYLNSIRMVVGTRIVSANPLHIVQPCAVGHHDKRHFRLPA